MNDDDDEKRQAFEDYRRIKTMCTLIMAYES